MSAVLQARIEEPAPFDGGDLLTAVREIAQGPLAKLADDIDRRGVYPRAVLEQLGAIGALGAHQRVEVGGRADYGLAIQAIAEVSRACGATGFMMWCHAACGLYMEASGNPALMGPRLARHARGETFGATGMSNPMKAYAGIEPLLLRARRVANGYVVNGALPWVSNLGTEHCLGALAEIEDTPEGEPRELMFLIPCNGVGVELRRCPPFSAMEGTETYAVRLTDHLVTPDHVLADPARPFIGRIRAGFVLLQIGMGLGVTQGAIDSMRKVERQLGHVNRFLDDRPDEMQAELDALTARTLRLAKTPFDTGDAFLAEVLEARADASMLALRAAQSALLHHGARGYLMSSAVQRRVRESHFVAIVTPAVKHLRKEVARLRGVAPV